MKRKAVEHSAAFELMRSGIYIVTSAYRRRLAGCTCVWVSRVSFTPPLLAVNLEPDCHTLATIAAGKRLCVNVLAERSLPLARKFGFSSGHDTDKFAGVAWHKGPSGAPILDEAVCWFDCKLFKLVPAGDHQIVIGELLSAAMQHDLQPALYDPAQFYVEPERGETARQAHQ